MSFNPLFSGSNANAQMRSLRLNGATSGNIVQQANGTTTPYSVFWPAAQGGASTNLQNDGAGNLSWAAAAATGANTFLSNLTSPTAINQDLLPSGHTTIGSATNWFSRIYTFGAKDTSDVTSVDFFDRQLQDTGGGLQVDWSTPGFLLVPGVVEGNNPGSSLTVQSQPSPLSNTGDMIVQSGASTSGNSGNLVLQIGSATVTRGRIQIKDGSEGIAGYVWTSTDTVGSGSWMLAASGANTALSNLTSPTAINQSLIFGSINGVIATPDSNTAGTNSLAIQTGAMTGVGIGGSSGGISIATGSMPNNTPNNIPTGSISVITGDSEGSGVASGGISLSTGNGLNGSGITGSISITTGSARFTGTSGSILLQTGPSAGGSITRGVIQFQDGSQGTAGQVWTSSDTVGSGTWAALNAANQTLSNLTSPTAINQDLIFNTGSANIKTPDGNGTAPLTVATGASNFGGGNISGVLTLKSGDGTGLNTGSGAVVLTSGIGPVGGNGSSGSVLISSGNSGTNSGNSGNVTLAIGTNAGAAGKIQFQDGSQGTAGATWTSTDTNGSGAWRNLGYFNGYIANANNWGTTGVTTSFATFSNQGSTPTMNTRYNSGISPSASSDAGFTFTPPSVTAAYEISVNVMPLVYTTADSVGFQLTDGTTVFAQMGYTTSSNGGANPTQNATLTGIYVPGTTSSVTVHIQVITNANSPVALVGYVGGQAAAAQIEVQIRQIAF